MSLLTISNVKIKLLHPDAIVPEYQTYGASGFDFQSVEDVGFHPWETKLVPTGLSFEIPLGLELQVRPRSGLSLKTSLRVSNSPGTVDADYRGQVCVIIQNCSDTPHIIKKGDRIAQGVLCPTIMASFKVVDELSDTDRGDGGFGSTGK